MLLINMMMTLSQPWLQYVIFKPKVNLFIQFYVSHTI